MSDSNEIPKDAKKIKRADFDQLARDKKFIVGPFISSFGDGPHDPYCPPSMRRVWGETEDGPVWADDE